MKFLLKEVYKQYFLSGRLGTKLFRFYTASHIGHRIGSSYDIFLDLTSDWDIEVFMDAELQNA